MGSILASPKRPHSPPLLLLLPRPQLPPLLFMLPKLVISLPISHTLSLDPWILNYGASDHLFGNKDLFFSLNITSPLPLITLANDTQTMAKGLYVPDSPFNLIFISKLMRDLNCSITFSNSFITLQDRSMGRTIGIKHESQGLFHHNSTPLPSFALHGCPSSHPQWPWPS